MWLRNKKTGRVCDAIVREKSNGNDEYSIIVCPMRKRGPWTILAEYPSLAKLYEEWEDYKPAEPLIKDEKARKAVRAWADMQRSCWIIKETDQCCRDSLGYFFNSRKEIFGGLELGIEYTITELCGEEKE